MTLPGWFVDYWQGWWAWQVWRWDHLGITCGFMLVAGLLLWGIGQGIAVWQRRSKPRE